MTTLGIDLGGTKAYAGVVDVQGRILASARVDTPPVAAGETVLESVVDSVARDLLDAHPGVTAVGLAAAGFVDATGSVVRSAPHLAWRDAPVRERFEARWGLPVVLDNDATAATHAEVRFGAARGAQDAVMVTVGTGIGGGIVAGGAVVRGRNGMAGELGHMCLEPGGHPCPCGLRGCWEQYASGRALERHARALMAERPTALVELCGGDPAALTGHMVSAAADAGDEVALAAFATAGDALGRGLANVLAALDPEVVVVGGGVVAAGNRLLGAAREALARCLVAADRRELPPVVPAVLGGDAGLLGAADLAREVGEARRA